MIYGWYPGLFWLVLSSLHSIQYTETQKYFFRNADGISNRFKQCVVRMELTFGKMANYMDQNKVMEQETRLQN